MDKENFKLMLQEGETHKVEFKESQEGLDKEIVAFANASGGRILVGVKDDGTIKGLKVTNAVRSQIQDIANNCQPKVRIDLEAFENVLILNVAEGKNKPYMCKKGFFIRLGPNAQKLPRDDILKFAIREGSLRYDEQINYEFDFEKDFDKKEFKEFLETSNITVNLAFENILFNMKLAEKEGNKYFFRNAVPLLFSNDIKKFNSSAYTTCVLFKGTTRAHIIDRKDFDGGLIEQVRDAVKFVEKNILLTYQIKTLARKEIPQYPIDAIREGIVNAIMHRDYFEKGSNVFIYVYDDFIEIINPGGLFGITKNQLGTVCARRNERIADLFKMVELVEKAGTGIQRMKDAMQKAGIKEPKIEPFENFFMVTFYGRKKGELGKISEGREIIELNERQESALESFKENEFITNTEYQKVCKTTKKTASRDLAELVKLGLLVRKGITGKGTRYCLAATKETKGDKGDMN